MIDTDIVQQMFAEYLPLIEQGLEKYIPEQKQSPAAVIYDAMRYSLLMGGKRIRPVLMMEFCRICGRDPREILPFACGIEMLHTYSLVHDDLPCMDNDDLRRGKPSNHKVFGEAMALLAGDGLLTRAFETMLQAQPQREGDCSHFFEAAGALAHCAGADGMVGGQVIDLQSEGKHISLEQLRTLDEGKTIALIQAACKMGCILADASPEQRHAAEQYAYGIGLTFQIVDDILDVTGDTRILGKKVGSDAQNEKSTYVSLLGVDGAEQIAEQLTAEAISALTVFGASADRLIALANYLLKRKK